MGKIGKLLQSAPVRKAKAFANRAPRLLAHLAAKEEDYRARPPIIVNSLPKSGTHLLMQIAQELPDRRYFGSFIAQTPSLTLRMRSQAEIDRRIAAIVPGEVLGTHLYYTPETEAAFRKVNAIHLFIWRDPRDVLLSEAHYLTKMNRWHAMHKSFAALPDTESRIRFSILGNGGTYPGAEERIGSYMGWLSSENCLSLRYEELVDPQTQLAECQRILDLYQARAQSPDPLPSADALVDAINPERSHTFNRGGIGRWRKEMSEANLALCQERLGPWLES
jgi:sulfotransferase 6B1